MDCNNYQKIVHGALWYNNKILLSKRLKDGYHKGFWQDVGGKMETYEIPIQAMVREIQEETGLILFHHKFAFIDCFIYSKRKIKTFLFEIGLTKDEITRIRNTEPDKQTNWKLFTLKEALKLKLMPSVKYYLESLNK